MSFEIMRFKTFSGHNYFSSKMQSVTEKNILILGNKRSGSLVSSLQLSGRNLFAANDDRRWLDKRTINLSSSPEAYQNFNVDDGSTKVCGGPKPIPK